MLKGTKTTLKDVAREAGVSSCLASKVLNGKNDGVWASDATRAKILEAASRLDYKPNISARRLAGASHDAIGVFFDHDRDLAQPFHSQALHEIIVRAEQLGYSVNVGMSGSGDKLKLLEKGVIDSAIVIISSAHNSEELGARFEAVSIPTVFLNPGRPISFNAVACDDLGGIAMAFDYLRGLGHEAARIAFLSGPSQHPSHEFRKNMVCELGGFFIAVPPRTTALDAKAALETCKATALIVCESALQPVYMACASLGVGIPDDISVIGVNGALEPNLFLPEPTTLKIPMAEMATRAVEMLDQLIKSGAQVPSVELKETLELRGSCAAPRRK